MFHESQFVFNSKKNQALHVGTGRTFYHVEPISPIQVLVAVV